MIKYYMLVKKKRIISIFEFLMHDILKQPTYLSRLLRNLPRAAAWTSELYVLCCLEENSKTCQKWPWGSNAD